MEVILVIVVAFLPGGEVLRVAGMAKKQGQQPAKERRLEIRAALGHRHCAERFKILYRRLSHIPGGALQAPEHCLHQCSSLHAATEHFYPVKSTSTPHWISRCSGQSELHTACIPCISMEPRREIS